MGIDNMDVRVMMKDGTARSGRVFRGARVALRLTGIDVHEPVNGWLTEWHGLMPLRDTKSRDIERVFVNGHEMVYSVSSYVFSDVRSTHKGGIVVAFETEELAAMRKLREL